MPSAASRRARIFIHKLFSKLEVVDAVIGLWPRSRPTGRISLPRSRRLGAAGYEKVHAEKISGAVTERPELTRLIRRLRPDDVLIVTRLDRLARSTRDLLNVLHSVGERGAGFRSLNDAWADTTTPHGRLMLTVLGGLAEFERELVRARTGEGRRRAMDRGVKFGRPPVLNRHQRMEGDRAAPGR